MTRRAHYVASTHWDREWYDTFQGFRMRLVALLDEVITRLEQEPECRAFVLDGQAIPLLDYLEVRPERFAAVRKLTAAGRLRLGPWYVLPDEWLVSGESLVRNLQKGIKLAADFGAPRPRAGFLCDMFGQNSQLPQIFSLFGLECALFWRGVGPGGTANYAWCGADGTRLPAHRFGRNGYCSYGCEVRKIEEDQLKSPPFEEKLRLFCEYARSEAARTPVGPVLLFDGADHRRLDPDNTRLLAAAAETLLRELDLELVFSTLDDYAAELAAVTPGQLVPLAGECRTPGRLPAAQELDWLIPGTLSSWSRLKQENARCEDELTAWTEPFCGFVTRALGREYPTGFLNQAWRFLLENHPHDSICGCSIDPVHQDMTYRFRQAYDLASRLTDRAFRELGRAALPVTWPEEALGLVVFNAAPVAFSGVEAVEIRFPEEWPTRFQEFFGYEEKLAFRIFDPQGREVPYQLLAQQKSRKVREWLNDWSSGCRRCHRLTVALQLEVPAGGYAVYRVEPAAEPTRARLTSLAISDHELENEFLRVAVNPNGSLRLLDKTTGELYDRLFTLEDCADIGDGWFHCPPVGDQVFTSAAAAAEVALTASGPELATLSITVPLSLPEAFDFAAMRRSDRRRELRIQLAITLKRGARELDCTVRWDNQVADHRLRLLFPSGTGADHFWCDSPFDVVSRPVVLPAAGHEYRELPVETVPQQSFTAVVGGRRGLALSARGSYETAVCDRPERPLALTLARSFALAVDRNRGESPGAQEFGEQLRHFSLRPLSGEVPVAELCRAGRTRPWPIRTVTLRAAERAGGTPELPPTHSFWAVEGAAQVSALETLPDGSRQLRLWNPLAEEIAVRVTIPRLKKATAVFPDGRPDPGLALTCRRGRISFKLGAKKIVTIRLE